MTSHSTSGPVSRRATIATLAGGGLGLAMAAASQPASARQEASPTAMANHPMVGVWVIDRVPDDPTELPTTNVYHADGTLTDDTVGAAGVWEATGPRTVNFTLIFIFTEGGGGYGLVRGSVEVDEGGNTAMGTAAGTIVAPDGTVVAIEEPFTSPFVRLRVEPMDAAGTPFAGFPAWTPPPATPAP